MNCQAVVSLSLPHRGLSQAEGGGRPSLCSIPRGLYERLYSILPEGPPQLIQGGLVRGEQIVPNGRCVGSINYFKCPVGVRPAIDLNAYGVALVSNRLAERRHYKFVVVFHRCLKW